MQFKELWQNIDLVDLDSSCTGVYGDGACIWGCLQCLLTDTVDVAYVDLGDDRRQSKHNK
eukprot:5716904-Amphidinium_carterae.4